MPSAYLVYNPFSGRYPSWLLVERAVRILEGHGWTLHTEQTESGEQITHWARKAADAGQDAFFVVGGDGSVNLALPGLIGSETALAVLPSGTANVWAQELGLPGLSWTRWMALEESARLLSQPAYRWVDIGMCNESPFLLWAGVGLDAFIVHNLEPRTRFEKHFAFVHYAATAAWNASQWRGVNMQVKVEGQEVSGHFLLGIISNIHLYAGGLVQLSSRARLDDGMMELWLFKGDTLGDTVQRVIDLLMGAHLTSDQISCYPFRSLELSSDTRTYIQVDGEPVVGNSPVLVRVVPKALKVLLPETTALPLFGKQIP